MIITLTQQWTVSDMTSGAYDILNEHQHIRRQVDALELALQKRMQGGRAWLDEVRPLLGELAKGLVSHSKGEEAEFFADIHRRLPGHVQTVARLTEQHQCLRQDFEMIASQAATLDPQQPQVVEEFTCLLSRTLRQLRAHEQGESELMRIAYWQDLDRTS
jgi:FtsZ-binding cell division protein ZapB